MLPAHSTGDGATSDSQTSKFLPHCSAQLIVPEQLQFPETILMLVPMTTDTWRLVGPNTFELRAAEDIPPLGSKELLLEVFITANCGSDEKIAHEGKHESQKDGENQDSEGLILGHEACCRVVAVGAEAQGRLKPGDIVVPEPGITCGECRECLDGTYNHCRNVLYLATPDFDKSWNKGTYTRYLTWPAPLCHKVPAGLAPKLAALAEPLAFCRQAIREMLETTSRFDPNQGQDGVILAGGGCIATGLLLQMHRRWPELRMVVMARDRCQRDAAESIGEGKVSTLPFPNLGAAWRDRKSHRDELEAAIMAGESLARLQELVSASRADRDGESQYQKEVSKLFKDAKHILNQRVACVFECTGQEFIGSAAMESRAVRSGGTIGLVSCTYWRMANDAWNRRAGVRTFPVRRSANQFPAMLEELAAAPEYFGKGMIGWEIPFEDIPLIYTGEVRRRPKIGDGPKIVIKY